MQPKPVPALNKHLSYDQRINNKYLAPFWLQIDTICWQGVPSIALHGRICLYREFSSYESNLFFEANPFLSKHYENTPIQIY